MTVYLVSGRVQEITPFPVPGEHERRSEIAETEFANVQHGEVCVLLGIWTEIPCIHFVFTDLETVQILHASNF